jgi:FKBP-type peptidyl-prolyl cis-trans isomerase 2
MAQAQHGDTVKIQYTGKLDDGSVFDSSDPNAPLAFTIGEGEVIPGVENGVVGMEEGETKTISIPPDEGYGPMRDELTVTVDRDQLPDGVEPEEGMPMQMQLPNGQVIPVRISEVSDGTVKIDANHPLAGKDLIFDVQLVEVEK